VKPEPLRPPGGVEFARLGGNIAVIRLIGRCSFQNSAYLERAVELCEREMGVCCYVLDLDRCESLDSTFLGVLAGLAMRQRKAGYGNLVAVNVSGRLLRTMSLLGLTHVLDVRERTLPQAEKMREVRVSETDRVEMSRVERVAHMLQAHQRLVELDSGNEARFESVLKHLGESLDRAKAAERRDEDEPKNEPEDEGV